MTAMNNEPLKQANATDYPVKISFDQQDNVYVAEFPDLPGCSAYGDNVDDAYRRAQEAKIEWLRVTLEQGLPIPKPSKAEEYSGRILLRVPSSLHAALVDRASLHGVSLNQYIVHALSGAVVGDTVNLELDELGNKIAHLEWRVAELSLYLRQHYVPGGTVVASTAIQTPQVGVPSSLGLQDYAQGYATFFTKTGPEWGQGVPQLTSTCESDWPSIGHRKQHAGAK